MGMCSSDNEREIADDYIKQQMMKSRPKNPGNWEKPATDEQMANYAQALVKWADQLPPDKEWDDGR